MIAGSRTGEEEDGPGRAVARGNPDPGGGACGAADPPFRLLVLPLDLDRLAGAGATAGAIFAGFDSAAPAPRPEYRGFLSFDILSVPPGALVESATVTLTADRVDLLPGSA